MREFFFGGCLFGSWFALFEAVDVLNLDYEIVQGTVCDIGNTKTNNSKGPVSVITAEGKKEKVEYVHYDLYNLHIGDEVEIVKIIRGSSENLVMKRNGEYTVFYQRFAVGKDEWNRKIRSFLIRYLVCSSIFFLVIVGLTLKKHKQELENICFMSCRQRMRYLQIWGILSVVYKLVLAYLIFGECDMDVVKWVLVVIYIVEKCAFALSIADRYYILEVHGMDVLIRDAGKLQKAYSRQDCRLEKIGRGKYYKLSLAGEMTGIVSGKNKSVHSLLYDTDILEEKYMGHTLNIITQEITPVQDRNVQEYLKEKAEDCQKAVRKMILLLICLSVMCLSALVEVLDSPMWLVLIVAYVALFGSAILAGIYVERSRPKRIRNQKILRVCEGEAIVVSQSPLTVRYRDSDGVLKVAKSTKENDAGKRGLGEKVKITLEDGKLVRCRGIGFN